MQKFKYVKIGIILFALYAIFKHNSPSINHTYTQAKKLTETPADVPPAKGSFIEQKIGNIITNTLRTEEGRTFLGKVIPDLPPIDTENLYVEEKELQSGTGKPIICGQEVQIKLLESNETIEKNIKLGARKVNKYIENAIISMKKGSIKELKVKDKNNLEKTILISVLDTVDTIQNLSKMRIFKQGRAISEPAKCGDEVSFRYRISDQNNNILLDSKNLGPIKVILGINELPISFLKALYNVSLGESISLIINKPLLYNLHGQYPTKFFPNRYLLKDSENYIVDIEIIRITKI